MRIDCPNCGSRERREFYYKGAALPRPAPEAGEGPWQEYMHLRDNPAGQTQEMWYHEGGCGAWLVVKRDTVSHEMSACVLAETAAGLRA